MLAEKVSNFENRLPSPQSELAAQTMKDPYIFDFIPFKADMVERDIEQALVKDVTKLLLELGTGFAFLGNQYHLNVGGDDFYIDLLFYNLNLRCYVVIELKTGEFKPEYAGQLNFYLSAVDGILKKEQDNPSIGLLLCKSKNDIIDGEASNGYSSVLDRDNSIDMNNSGEWFCDVWAEDYDNNKISGIKFELRDNKNNLIEEWTSSNTPHRITGLSAGKYIINEINVVGDYMTSNNNYTYEINTYESNQNVLAIKHIKKGVVLEDKTNNILNTGKKEYIDDK